MHSQMAWFDDEAHSSGKLTAHLATDAAYVRGAVGDVFGVVLQNLSTLALGYVIGFIFDWRMALLITGGVGGWTDRGWGGGERVRPGCSGACGGPARQRH